MNAFLHFIINNEMIHRFWDSAAVLAPRWRAWAVVAVRCKIAYYLIEAVTLS
jgi:hypothetical protein